MLRRSLVLVCALLLIAASPPAASAHAARNTQYVSSRSIPLEPSTLHAPRSPLEASLTIPPPALRPPPSDSLPALCPTFYQLQHPEGCPDVGPGGYAERLVAAGLPYPLPALTIEPVYPYLGLTPDAYGRIITDTAPVYRHPLEALAGLPPARIFEKGFVFVSLTGKTTVQGATFYEINPGEFVPAEDIEEFQPSGFAGMHFAAPPGTAVGWTITNVQPSAVPGQPPDPNAPFAGRYQYFQVLGAQRVGEWNWYLIGPDQWVEQRNVALVQPAPPPGADGTAIAVDTYEQAMGVYQNGQLIFATLVSSGSRYFPTRPGTFHVWAKLKYGRMTGAYRPDRSDYYFLEDVPWILYYDGDRALHGAYWHDHFGTKGSHGCVNLSPRDARWLYDYASVGTTVVIFSSQ
jgi:L,D-transpeptidase-like protein